MRVQNVTDAYQQEDQDFAANTLEADLAGQLLIGKSAHHTGDVVDGHEGQKCIEQAVAAAEEPAQPAANRREDKLDRGPEFFHRWFSSLCKNKEPPQRLMGFHYSSGRSGILNR